MRVTHETDHITHAVIGTEETINFGISDDPAFFQVLSSTLYKQPMLAVVRETLCNAWDAHIDAGITDKAIVITQDETHITIRDFGKGIPHELIGPIYGIYGASTKKSDSGQTGGFGLGCKAPFAYTDHFEVTSWHNGVKSIYAMSKSSASVKGKPGITRLLQVPTDQTGLQVKIRVQPNEARIFTDNVNHVVALGGIKAVFNDEAIAVISLTTVPGTWNLVTKNFFTNAIRHNQVFVRYGNVVYPVDNEQTYNTELSQLIRIIMNYTNQTPIVIQAFPNTLSVMPNREALSLQDETCTALKKLLRMVVIDWKARFISSAKEYISQNMEKIGATKNVVALMRFDRLPCERKDAPLSRKKDPIPGIVQWYIGRQHLHDTPELVKYSMVRRFKAMQDSQMFEPGLLQSFVKAYWLNNRYTSSPRSLDYYYFRKWYCQHVLRRIGTAFAAHSLSNKSLFVYSTTRQMTNTTHALVRPSVVLTQWHHREKTVEVIQGALYKTIFLTPSKKYFTEWFEQWPGWEGKHSSLGTLAYIMPVKRVQWDTVRTTFASLGYTVVDLTQAQPWIPVAPEPEAAPTVPVVRQPRPKGVRTLLSYYDPVVCRLEKQNVEKDTSERILKPEYYALLRTHRDRDNNNVYIDDLSQAPFHTLIKPIADKGAAIVTTTSVQKYITKKIPSVAEYVIRHVTDHITNSPTIKSWRSQSVAQYNEGSFELDDTLVKLIEKNEKLQKHFGLSFALTDDDKYALKWWKHIMQNRSMLYIAFQDGSRSEKYIQDTNRYLESIPYTANLKVVYKRLVESDLVSILDFKKIHSILYPKQGNPSPSPITVARAEAILFSAL
jgi:Histidine kinase-, DNA gyrase B-, and HSP90-like ATPase